ncbi:hypothetical protein K1719_022864 [Acacia pycnantha]|nr:hypothetical protein K1719_022864 [Acacia pycnantha]
MVPQSELVLAQHAEVAEIGGEFVGELVVAIKVPEVDEGDNRRWDLAGDSVVKDAEGGDAGRNLIGDSLPVSNDKTHKAVKAANLRRDCSLEWFCVICSRSVYHRLPPCSDFNFLFLLALFDAQILHFSQLARSGYNG